MNIYLSAFRNNVIHGTGFLITILGVCIGLISGISYDLLLNVIPFILIIIIVYESVSLLYYPKLVTISKLFTLLPNNNRLQYYYPFLLFMTLIFNLAVLFEIWSGGDIGNQYNAIGGLIPYSDAFGYYNGARYLIEFGELLEISCFRPLASVFYAVLLKLTLQNLQLTILVTTILVAISIYYVGKAICKVFGLSAGFLVIILLSFYYIEHNGMLLTEPIGFMLGNWAFVLLWHGILKYQKKVIYYGLFMISLALSVRAGAMFVIPILVLFLGFFFKNKGSYYNIKVALVGSGFAFMALISSPILLKFIGPVQGYTYQGNFAFTLYGLVKGGKSWDQFRKDYPNVEATTNDTKALYSKAYAITFKEFKKNPYLLFRYIFATWIHILKNPFNFLFNFDFIFHKNILLFPFLLTFIGLFILKDTPEHKLLVLLTACIIGIILSAPFLILLGSRVYAATISINCAFISIGLGILIKILGRRQVLLKSDFNLNKFNLSYIPLSITFIIVLCMLLGPLFIQWTCPKHDFEQLDTYIEHCEQDMIVRLSKGAFIQTTTNNNTFLPKSSLINLHKPLQRTHTFKEGQYLIAALNLKDRSRYGSYLIFDENVFGQKENILPVCVEQIPSKGFSLYKAEPADKPLERNNPIIKIPYDSKVLSASKHVVNWKDSLRVSINSNSILSNSSSGGWDKSGANSQNILETTVDGCITARVKGGQQYVMFGMSEYGGTFNPDYITIDYAIHLRGDKKIYIFEKGKLKGDFGNYYPNDIIRIDRVDGKIYYLINDKPFYVSERYSNTLLNISVSFNGIESGLFKIKSSF